jgi:hypothetical protein
MTLDLMMHRDLLKELFLNGGTFILLPSASEMLSTVVLSVATLLSSSSCLTVT